jgi:nucleotide-binding universal stress UspA family protein
VGALPGCAPLPPAPEDLVATAEVVESEARADVTSLVRHLGPGVRERVEVGDPGVAICRLAGEEQVDMIVVGSHGNARSAAIHRLRSSAAWWIEGATAYRLTVWPCCRSEEFE